MNIITVPSGAPSRNIDIFAQPDTATAEASTLAARFVMSRYDVSRSLAGTIATLAGLAAGEVRK